MSKQLGRHALVVPVGSDQVALVEDLDALAASVDVAISGATDDALVATTAAQDAAEAAAATVAEQAPRLLTPVDAAVGGSYSVGTNYRSLPFASTALVSQSLTALQPQLLSAVDAPTIGPWSVGTNYRSLPVGSSAGSATALPQAVGASGLKQIRVPVTVGFNPQGSPSYGSATVRYLLRWNFPVSRWRLIVRNVDIRSGDVRAEGADFTGVWVGKHDGAGGFTTEPVRALAGFTLASAGAEYVSGWTAARLPTSAAGECLVSLGYTLQAGANTSPWAQLGTGYQLAGDPGKGAVQSGAGFVRLQAMPFSVVIEVETPVWTPVVAVMGDSLSVGVSSTSPVLDSAISQWAQPRGVIPVMGGSSGDLASNCTDLTAYKWSRWLGSSNAPDALLYALGTNDLGSGRSAVQLQADTEAILSRVQGQVTPVTFAQQIIPRGGSGGWDAPKEAQRNAYNAWLATLPLRIRALWMTQAAVSTDGTNLNAVFDPGDHLHLNTSGYASMQSVYGAMTSPAPAFTGTWP